MPADYDLIVLGGSVEGRVAAVTAVGYGARVALVEPPGLFAQRQQQRYLLQALQQLAAGSNQQQVSDLFREPAVEAAERRWDWQMVLEWSAIASQTQTPELSVATMNASGIDVVLEPPERFSPQLVVTTATRRIKARGVIAAFGSVPLPVFDDGFSDGLSPSTGIEALLNAAEQPDALDIWGDSVEAVMWAQALQAMGTQVSLVGEDFLPYEDWDVRRLVRSQLAASGIRFLSVSEALQTKEKDFLGRSHSPSTEKSLLFGKSRSALVLPDFVYHPTSAYPDTDAQRLGRTYLFANQRLQTLHPRVFACGSLLSGLPMHESVAKAEAQVAVHNALFLSTQKMRYQAIPEAHHHFARVGLTPRFARQGTAPSNSSRSGKSADKWAVWTASSPNSTDLASILPSPTVCKLICYKGRLQSAHLLGAGAGELIELLSAFIGRPLTAIETALPESLPVTHELMTAVKAAIAQSFDSRWQPGHWRRDWAENWFNWRRSQSK